MAAGRRIAWVSLAASVVAFIAAVCAIFVHVIHVRTLRGSARPESEGEH